MRLALPMPGWGTSPSPAISLDVSTMTTRLCAWSARTRATSRSIVVLPTPGLPSIRMLLPDKTRSSMILLVPKTARPTRQVRPITLPLRFRMPAMRCSVRSMPARLSPPKGLKLDTTPLISSSVVSCCPIASSRSKKRAWGGLPRSRIISKRPSRGSRSCNQRRTRWGKTSSRDSKSSTTTFCTIGSMASAMTAAPAGWASAVSGMYWVNAHLRQVSCTHYLEPVRSNARAAISRK